MDRVRLAELCASTSMFTDLGTGQPTEHGLRTCLVAMRLAGALGADADACREAYYVSLLRFIGCTADAHGVAEMAGGDEIRFFSGMAPASMGSPREEMVRLLRLVGEGAPLPRRLRLLAGALTDPKGKERLLAAHCEVASRLADEMGLPPGVIDALGVAYARWDGRGVPSGLAGEDIPSSVRVAIVARDVELWGREAGAEATRETLLDRRERAYAPDVVDAVLELGVDELRRCDDDLWDVVLSLEPEPHEGVSGPWIRRALGALGDFADLKAPELTGHARRVARTAAAAGEAAGLGPEDAELLERAALVHDVGVVGVPTGILRGAARSPTEQEHFRLHPMWSRRILGRCAGLEEVAAIAGAHHERIDGSGYPSGTTGDPGRPAGLLACVELYEELATRDAPEAMARLGSDGALDRRDVEAVLEAVGVTTRLPVELPAGLTEREAEVLRLLATGSTNRAIAETLGISAKTVGSHVEHIYTKAGVRTRAAATLFAMQHDLIG